MATTLSLQPPPKELEKPDVIHQDDLPVLDNNAADNLTVLDAQLKSSYDRYTIWQSLKTFKRAIFICGITGFSAATDGYQQKLSANVIANAGFIGQFKPQDRKTLDPTHVSTFGGLTSVGFVIGQFLIPRVNDRFGRKIGTYTFLFTLAIAAVIEAVGTVWWHWTIAKLFAGMGIGACQATLPVFINEHAPAAIRGSLIVAYSAWNLLGQLFASLTLKVRADVDPMDYKTPIYTQFGMIAAAALMMVFLPESPWYLANRGRLTDARRVLDRVYKGVLHYDGDRELGIIVHTIEQQKFARAEGRGGRLEIFRGLNLKRFLIASWPKVLQQFVGLAIFSNYSAYFFKLAGNKDPFMVTVILGVVNVVAVVFDIVLVDRIGRRWMTLIGFGGVCFGVTLMAIIGCLDYETPQLGATLVFAGVSASFFNSFQQSTSYAYLTELPLQHLKALSIGWGLAYCNLYAIIFSFVVPIILDKWAVRASFLFVALGVPGTILAFFIMPESTGRSSAEIHEMFTDRVPLRKWRGYKTAVERDLDAREGRVA